MKKNIKQKILVLVDPNEPIEYILEYIQKLAKQFDANLECFSVRKVAELIDVENPLSAMRVLNGCSLEIDNQMKEIRSIMYDRFKTHIKTSFALGHVNHEIENKINRFKPDIIVLGKRKTRTFNFLGDNVEEFISQKYEGIVLRASNYNDNKFLNINKSLQMDESFNTSQ